MKVLPCVGEVQKYAYQFQHKIRTVAGTCDHSRTKLQVVQLSQCSAIHERPFICTHKKVAQVIQPVSDRPTAYSFVILLIIVRGILSYLLSVFLYTYFCFFFN